MSGIYGADVAQLRDLARQFDRSANQLDADRMSVGNAIQVKAWIGPAAVQFRMQWDSDHSRCVHAAAIRLRNAAASLRTNADDQDRTSAVGVGSAGGNPTTNDGIEFPADSTGSAGVLAWWRSFSPEQRARLIQDSPGRVGSLDGLPGHVRDEANRIVLQQELREIRSQLCPAEPVAAKAYLDKLKALEQLEKIAATNEDAQILLIDSSSYPVKAAVSLGDVDKADHIGVFTQGVSSQVGKDDGLIGPVRDMLALKKETQAQLALSGRSSETVATVVWMGYDAPAGMADGTSSSYADRGSVSLARFADGLRSGNSDAHISGLGHSYGSYVTALAAQQTDAFDSVVAFGSPGLGTDNASDIRVDSGCLYTLETNGWWGDNDYVADSGVHGGDPSRIEGAIALKTDSWGDREDSNGHSEYLKDRSTSQRNIALVLGGLHEKVIRQ